MSRIKLLAFFLIFFTELKSHVLIMTYAYNRPDFIDLQCKTLQKFVLDDYEYVVFNDAPPGPIQDAIIDMCQFWNVTCINVPQELHHRKYSSSERLYSLASRRHTNAINFSLKMLGYDHEGPVVLLDGDIFLIRPFSFSKMLEDCDIASVLRVSDKKITYLWPGLNILAMDRLPEKEMLRYNCGKIKGHRVDSGGATAKYLMRHPKIRLKELNQIFSYQIFCPDKYGNYDHTTRTAKDQKTPVFDKVLKLSKMGFNEKEIEFILKEPDTINFACNNCFLHYRNSCGWDGDLNKSYNDQKTNLFNEFINNIIRPDT